MGQMEWLVFYHWKILSPNLLYSACDLVLLHEPWATVSYDNQWLGGVAGSSVGRQLGCVCVPCKAGAWKSFLWALSEACGLWLGSFIYIVCIYGLNICRMSKDFSAQYTSEVSKHLRTKAPYIFLSMVQVLWNNFNAVDFVLRQWHHLPGKPSLNPCLFPQN